jgi:molybdopterin-guanine dinucleotide biosynthesis protein A
MGPAKATLPWHGSTLVRRVAGIVARGVEGPVVIVRSPGQTLPDLPPAFEVLDDLEEGHGPLAGLSVGLRALDGRCETTYVSSTDVPFLHPAFVRRVMSSLDADSDACVPMVRGFRQPLAAAYRTGLAPLVTSLVEKGHLRVSLLLEACRVKELDEKVLLDDHALASLDPGLDSVTNLNDPQQYDAARARPEPRVQVHWPDGAGALDAGGSFTAVRATTVARAARAVGLELSRHLVVTLNGFELGDDPEEPLAEGDVVRFRADTKP